MSSLTITTRKTRSGPRYVVRYRLGGRAYPIEHGGSFRTMREAKIRRDLVAGEIASGRNPRELLEAMLAMPAPVLTLSRWRDRFIASRIDVDDNTSKNYRSALKKACETFGERDPGTITADEVATWVAGLAQNYKPGTIALYLLSLRMLFDFIGLEPNVARDPRIKKPKQVREEPQPPTADHFLAIIEALGERWRLLFVTIEQGALRLGEAVSLRWADVDAANLRLRLPLGDQARPGALGLPARVADRGDRGDLPARGSRPGAPCVRRDHRGDRLPSDEPRLPQREGAALQPALAEASEDHDLAPGRRPGTRARGTGRTRTGLDEPRRLLARDAAGRGRGGEVPAPSARRSTRGVMRNPGW